MTGARALAVTVRIHVHNAPTPTDILRRSGLSAAQAHIELAAEMLKGYGYNTKVAAWKVAHLRAAGEWFGRSLLALVALAILLGTYNVSGTDFSPQPQGSAHPMGNPKRI